MKLTKYTHACLVLEEQGQKLVVDPGEWNSDLPDVTGVVAVVVTHNHFDHCNAERIQAILAANPGVKIYGTEEVAHDIPGVQEVEAGDTATVGPFTLTFYGDRHALVHGSQPQTQNVGVLINDLYYPGDSYTPPEEGTAVKTLALPVSGPWLQLGDAMDMIMGIRPQLCIPTHDHMLSPDGEEVTDEWVKRWCESLSVQYRRLALGESVEA